MGRRIEAFVQLWQVGEYGSCDGVNIILILVPVLELELHWNYNLILGQY